LALGGLAAGGVGCTAQPAADALATVAPGAGSTGDLPDLAPAAPASVPDGAAALRSTLVDAINQERSSHGLAPVAVNKTLNDMAAYHLSRMIEGNFFAHVDPYDNSNVGARAEKFDYPYLRIGENLAAGQASPEQVLADWLASAPHRAILLDGRFREIGVGVLDGGRLGRYWAVEFGTQVGR